MLARAFLVYSEAETVYRRMMMKFPDKDDMHGDGGSAGIDGGSGF